MHGPPSELLLHVPLTSKTVTKQHVRTDKYFEAAPLGPGVSKFTTKWRHRNFIIVIIVRRILV